MLARSLAHSRLFRVRPFIYLSLCNLFFTFILLFICAYKIFGSSTRFSTIPFTNFLASSLLISVYSFLACTNLSRAGSVLCLFHLVQRISFLSLASLHLSLIPLL